MIDARYVSTTLRHRNGEISEQQSVDLVREDVADTIRGSR